MKTNVIFIILIYLCLNTLVQANDAITPRNISASSLKHFVHIANGHFGNYTFQYDIKALAGSATTSTYNGECCATIKTEENSVKCSI